MSKLLEKANRKADSLRGSTPLQKKQNTEIKTDSVAVGDTDNSLNSKELDSPFIINDLNYPFVNNGSLKKIQASCPSCYYDYIAEEVYKRNKGNCGKKILFKDIVMEALILHYENKTK